MRYSPLFLFFILFISFQNSLAAESPVEDKAKENKTQAKTTEENKVKTDESSEDNREQKLSNRAKPAIKEITRVEGAWRDEIGASIKIGKRVPVPLYDLNGEDKKNSFLGFYTEQNLVQKRGSIVIIHDKAGHPDWKTVVRPLRTKLPDIGWNTLSVQLPVYSDVSDDEAILKNQYEASFEYIYSALAYLKTKKEKKIMMVAYGTSAINALRYLAFQSDPKTRGRARITVLGLVMVSPYSKTEKRYIDADMLPLKQLKMPILDIYGRQDLDLVTMLGAERYGTARRNGNALYAQQIVENANHFFVNQQGTIVKRVHSFFMSIVFPTFKLKRPRGKYLLEIR